MKSKNERKRKIGRKRRENNPWKFSGLWKGVCESHVDLISALDL